MRVRLTYSEKLSEITNKVSDLAAETIEPLAKNLKLIESLVELLRIEGDDCAIFVNGSLDRIRKSITEIDEVLAEANALLEAYVNGVVNAGLPEPEQPQPQSTSQAPSNVWDPKTKSYKNKDDHSTEEVG